MSAAEAPAPNNLDAATRQHALEAVTQAKANGWSQDDLRRWFADNGVSLADWKAATAGGAVSDNIRGLCVQISITGLPHLPREPNAEDIQAHLDWLTSPARGTYDDALVEIASGRPDSGINRARLFGLDELGVAADYAVEQNLAGCNVYVGAALRLPDADRTKRASDEDFYVATAVPIDIDKDYDNTRAAMAAVCEDGLVVTTGLTPERRSQHWVRLVEPCDDVGAFGQAFASLVAHTGADQAVKDAARVMRLGGTVSMPSERKRKNGYAIELTTVSINPQARPSSIEALADLAPDDATYERRDYSGRPKGTGIERDWTGRITNGREEHWRDLILRAIREYQESCGADPAGEDIWNSAWPLFSDPRKVENSDGRWTSPDGQHQLRQRIANSIRRLRLGRLASFGLCSVETGLERERAEAAKAQREARRAAAEAARDAARAPPIHDTATAETATPPVEEQEPEPAIPAAAAPLANASEIPPHLLQCPGLVGEIVDFIVATARFPQPSLALGAALCLVGTAAGRRYAGPTRSGTHLYVLALAKTGAGKNHAAKMSARILQAAQMGEHIGPAQYMSMSAVFKDLGSQPLKLAFIDEFGGYMARITTARGSPHERAVKDILRTAWGCSFETLRPLSYADESRKVKTVDNPALSIYGMSTPHEFYAALQGTDVFNGFLNRWLIIPTDRKPAEVDPDLDEFDVPSKLIDGMVNIAKAVAPLSGTPTARLDWESAEARLFHKAFRLSIEAREEDAALLSRVAEMAVRLATIRAIGRTSIVPAVSLADITWGCELALWSAERMVRDAESFMVETEHQGRVKLVLRLLKEAPKRRLSRSELTRKLQHQFDARTLDGVVQGLIEAEQVAILSLPSEAQKVGRKGVVYSLLTDGILSQAAA